MRGILCILSLLAALSAAGESIWNSTNMVAWFDFNTPAMTNEAGLLVHSNKLDSPYALVGNARHADNRIYLRGGTGVSLMPNFVPNSSSEFTVHFVYLGGPEVGTTGNVMRVQFTNNIGAVQNLWRVGSVGYPQGLSYDAFCLLFWRDHGFSGPDQLLFAYSFTEPQPPATHIALVHSPRSEPRKWVLYVNGKFIGNRRSGVFEQRWQAAAESLVFGYSQESAGVIDDVILFDRALTQAEVTELLGPSGAQAIRGIEPRGTPTAMNPVVHIPGGDSWRQNFFIRSTNLIDWERLHPFSFYVARPSYVVGYQEMNTGLYLQDVSSFYFTTSEVAFYRFAAEAWDYAAHPPYEGLGGEEID